MKRYIGYSCGKFFEYTPSLGLFEQVAPQGSISEYDIQPMVGDVYRVPSDVRGRNMKNLESAAEALLPYGLKFDGPHGLDDDIYVVIAG